MATKRPTEAQRKALLRMKSGNELWTVLSRGGASAFWHHNLAERAPSIATLHAMRKARWIKSYENTFNGAKYRITEDGRVAIFRIG